jgi:hypothetical protein
MATRHFDNNAVSLGKLKMKFIFNIKRAPRESDKGFCGEWLFCDVGGEKHRANGI